MNSFTKREHSGGGAEREKHVSSEEELLGIVLEDRERIEAASSFEVDSAIAVVVACDSSVEDDTSLVVVVHRSCCKPFAVVVVVGWPRGSVCCWLETVNLTMMASEMKEQE